MSEKNAVVTLTIGGKVSGDFNRNFRPLWETYCSAHGLGLVQIDRPLDDSPRAAARSPSWQKLRVHRVRETEGFDRLAWVDADVMIRPDAPNIFDAAPPDKVGAVDDFATPTREDHDFVLDGLYRKWDAAGIEYVSNRTPAEFYLNYGISCDLDSVVQAGVMVFTPGVHGRLFDHVYNSYEEGATLALNHEMRPLSYELLTAGAVHWINPKFNMQWGYYKTLHYPFLARPAAFDMFRWPKVSAYEKVLSACVNAAFRHNFFLHFAGGSKDFRFVNTTP
jgi:hypothetical protein